MHAMHEAILGSGDVGTIVLRWTMTALLIAGFVCPELRAIQGRWSAESESSGR